MRRPAATAAALAALLAGPASASAQSMPPLFWLVGSPDPANQPAGTVNLALVVGARGRDAELRYRTEGGAPYAGPGRTGNVPLAQLEGLTPAQVAAADARVVFRLRRPAGTFACEGALKGGRGSGSCAFDGDEAFAAHLERSGVGRPTEAQLRDLAMNEVELGLVDELAAQGYATPSLEELAHAGRHGVSLAFLRSMGAAGFRGRSLRELVQLADHKVTPEFVREVNARAGSRQSLDAILRQFQRG